MLKSRAAGNDFVLSSSEYYTTDRRLRWMLISIFEDLKLNSVTIYKPIQYRAHILVFLNNWHQDINKNNWTGTIPYPYRPLHNCVSCRKWSTDLHILRYSVYLWGEKKEKEMRDLTGPLHRPCFAQPWSEHTFVRSHLFLLQQVSFLLFVIVVLVRVVHLLALPVSLHALVLLVAWVGRRCHLSWLRFYALSFCRTRRCV